jgi:hypothetical protein
MKFKITVHKNVKIRANIRGEKIERIGSNDVIRNSETQEWISLKAGEVRDGLGFVWGVSPEFAPERMAGYSKFANARIVPLPDVETGYPMDVFGLFTLEKSTIPD